jgi:integrase/recombinase XerD
MRRLSISRVEGVLAPHASGFRLWLGGRGYRPATVEDQVWLMAHLSRWLDEQGVAPAAFTDGAAERFQRARRERYSHLTGSRALRPLLYYLRGLGVVPEPRASVSPADAVIAAYRGYLLAERGLVEGSVVLHARVARLFLGEMPDPIDAALAHLRAGDVSRFVVAQCGDGRRGKAWASTLVSGLRSLLTFLHVTGRVPVPLAAAVPSVASWRLSSLPRGLDRDHVMRILKSCDRDAAVGRRDYAILMLLARLGLRACEIAGLMLDDIDWCSGDLTIHGKGDQTDRLPLPRDVGQALVASLRDPRRDGGCRAVFVRTFAPDGALSVKAIGAVLRDACDRAGVPRVGTHRLRHSVATELLAAGAPLTEIALVLRHTNLSSTAIYAKVDRAALRVLARPWPLTGAAT